MKRRASLLALGIFLGGVIAWFVLSPDAETPEADGSNSSSSANEPPDQHGSALGNGSAALPGLKRIRLGRARSELEPELPHGKLSGRVISLGSHSGVAAELTFDNDGISVSVTASADGTFVFSPPNAGSFALALVTAEGHLPYAPSWGESPIVFRAAPGQHVSGIEIQISPAVMYQGTVTNDRGEPVEGALVHVSSSSNDEQALVPLTTDFISDRAGGFAFTAADGALVEAQHPQFGRARAHVDFSVQASHQLSLKLEAAPAEWTGGERLQGTVVDQDGEPIAGALVVASAEILHPVGRSRTESDGTFVVDGLDRVSHSLVISASGFARWAEREVAAGATVNATLEPEAILVGVVVDAEGNPVPAATVVVQQSRGALARETVGVVSTFGFDGAFALGGLGPGTYLVTAGASGHALATELSVELPSSEPVSLVLQRGGVLRGRVTSNGEALAGAHASSESRLGEGGLVPIISSATTDDEGWFELTGVVPGLGSVFFAAAGHHSRIRSGLRVEPASELIVNVELTPVEDGEASRIELAGIGAVLAAEEDVLVIREVVEGGGAAEAGLIAGDEVVLVAGQPVSELGFGGSIELIRGPEDSVVVLRVRRDEEESDVEVPRRRIRV